MSEILKSHENLDLQRDFTENLNSVNIEKIEWIMNPEFSEKKDYLSEKTKDLCKSLNKIFWEEFEKKWINFYDALKVKVENPIT